MSDIALPNPPVPATDIDIFNLPAQENAPGVPMAAAGETLADPSVDSLDMTGLSIAEEDLQIDEKASSMDFPPPPPEIGNPYRVTLKRSQKGVTVKVLKDNKEEVSLDIDAYMTAVKSGQPLGKVLFFNANLELEILADKNGVAPPSDRKGGKIFDQATTVPMGGTNRAFDILTNILKIKLERPWTHSRIIGALWAALADPQVKAFLQWRAYCKNCDVSINGERAFPQLADGSRRSTVPCTKCGSDLQAQARVTKYMPL